MCFSPGQGLGQRLPSNSRCQVWGFMIFSYWCFSFPHGLTTWGFSFHRRVPSSQTTSEMGTPSRSYRQQTVFRAQQGVISIFPPLLFRTLSSPGWGLCCSVGQISELQYPVVALPLEIRAFLSVSRRKISLLGNERSLNRSAPEEGTNKIPSKQSSSLTFCFLLSTNETCCNFLSLSQNYFFWNLEGNESVPPE